MRRQDLGSPSVSSANNAGAAFRLGDRRGDREGSIGRQFELRARRYHELDSRLSEKTRFFGAACITNCVLGHLASGAGAAFCPRKCVAWLFELGAVLESQNLSIAAAITDEPTAGAQLDQRMVAIEQTLVEDSLRISQLQHRGSYSRLLVNLNSLLNRSWFASFHFSATVRWYWQVLAEVRNDLAVPINFSEQYHRERLGMGLIRALHRESSVQREQAFDIGGYPLCQAMLVLTLRLLRIEHGAIGQLPPRQSLAELLGHTGTCLEKRQ